MQQKSCLGMAGKKLCAFVGTGVELGNKLVYSRETLPLILMQLQITFNHNTVIKQSKRPDGDLKPEHRRKPQRRPRWVRPQPLIVKHQSYETD